MVFLLWAPKKRTKSTHEAEVLGVIMEAGVPEGHLSNQTRKTSFPCWNTSCSPWIGSRLQEGNLTSCSVVRYFCWPFPPAQKIDISILKGFLGAWYTPKEQPFFLPPLLFHQVKLETEMWKQTRNFHFSSVLNAIWLTINRNRFKAMLEGVWNLILSFTSQKFI